MTKKVPGLFSHSFIKGEINQLAMTYCNHLAQLRAEKGDLFKTGMPVNYIEIRGTKLAYEESGEGEPVVFVHGGLSDLRAWSEQQSIVSQLYRAVSYSRRYHQPNEQSERSFDYSPDIHAADLAAFLKALNLGKAHLVGRSYGAAVALLMAVRHPELIRSLTLGEPSPFINLLGSEGKTFLSRQRAGFHETILLLKNGKKEWAIRQFLNVVVGADVLDQLNPLARTVFMENAATLEPMLKTYYDFNISDEPLKRLTMPTLLISGEFSPGISRLNNEKINDCLPNSRLAVLQGASHGLHMENPDGFNKMLLEFLSNQ